MKFKIFPGGGEGSRVEPVQPIEKLRDERPREQKPDPREEQQTVEVGLDKRYFLAQGGGYDAHGKLLYDLFSKEEAIALGLDWEQGKSGKVI